MKVANFTIVILSTMLMMTCAINAKKKVVQEEVIVKTPIELAIEKAQSAESAYMEKDMETAITNYTQAIDLYTSALSTATEADSVQLQIFRLKQNIAKIHIDIAFSQVNQSEYDQAITEYESGLNTYKSIKPESAPKDSIEFKINNLYYNLAICCKEAGEYQKAIEYFDLYLEAYPNEDSILLEKFNMYKDNLKDEPQAFEVLKQYATSKNDFAASNKLGELYWEKNDTDNAILWFEKARSIKDDTKILPKLAALYRTKQQWENANQILLQFVTTNPDQEELKKAYKLIGDDYSKLKNKPKAVEYFEKYLALDYDESLALFVSMYYYDLKNNNKSMSYANIVLAKNPNNANALLFRAIAKYNLKDMKGAKADFERIQNDPKNGNTAQQYLKIIK